MKQRTNFTLLMLLFASILFFGCSKSNETVSLNADGSVHTSGDIPITYAATIGIERATFNPANVTVMQSGRVLWVNKDNQVHTVTSEGEGFDSGDIQPGGQFSFTFNAVGPYSYRCKYHPEQTGIVKSVTK